jgi:uncharacterized protein involved in cysteine biosynthesis
MIERSNPLKAVRLGLSIGTFLVVLYLGCLALALIIPDRGLHQPWLQFLAGFSWTLPGILLGLVEAFFYGLISGVIFAPIYNAFNTEGR